MNTHELISVIAQKMASGELSADCALPAIRKLSRDEKNRISNSELIEMLHDGFDPPEKLLAELEKSLRSSALEYHDLIGKHKNIPAELSEQLKDFPLYRISKWKKRSDILSRLNDALKCLNEYRSEQKNGNDPEKRTELISSLPEQVLSITRSCEWDYILPEESFYMTLAVAMENNPRLIEHQKTLQEQFKENENKKRNKILGALDELPEPLPENINDKLALKLACMRYESAKERKKKKALLDLLCLWKYDSVAPVLSAINEPWARKRAQILLTLRFGKPEFQNWFDWQKYLNKKSYEFKEFKNKAGEFALKNPAFVLLLWYLSLEDQNPSIVKILMGTPPKETPLDVSEKPEQIPSTEDKRIVAPPPPPPPPPPAPKAKPETPQAVPPLEKPRKPETPLPSLWQDHIQPFFAENWYMAAGIFMVIVGSSLLAYYTWDKHWLVPYTIMPTILACFTAGLAGVGSWVEKRGREFLNMAAMLRGAAIALLPVNFMTVALLSNDARVSHKIIIVPIMGLIYLLLGGWGLKRWCSAMNASLKNLLGMTLLLLNALVIVAPMAKILKNWNPIALNLILGTGFYIGFAAIAFATVIFTKNILNKEMAAEKRLPWFFGTTLAVTFLQVFAWVHGFLGYLPNVSTYAAMTILSGGLVFFIEKRALQLKDKSSMHEMESFLGFALIFLGVLMGAAGSGMRILSFELAGIIWMFQAFSRKHPLHYWISLTLMVLGGASVSLLKSTHIWLPTGQWLPILGLAIAASISALIWLADKKEDPMLREASTGMQTVVLAITSVTAILAQWHYSSKPLYTAFYLIAVVAIFFWRAFRDNKLRYVHTAMLILGLVLPYLGCVDITGRTLQGNSMVFGLAVLSFLWLGALWILKHPLLVRARSTVVIFYGIVALSAMILRISAQRGMPVNVFMDYTGPLLIAAALVFITYYSRSLIPAAIAAVILIILFPELKSHFKEEFDNLGWGTGLGSAFSALGLTIACFILRELKFLKNLGEGDLFLGKVPFSLRRFDHTLFTWPIIASALFLICKTDTVTFARNLMDNGRITYNSLMEMPFNTSLALIVTGLCWTLLGIYHRRHRIALAGIHLGWIWVFVGLTCAYYYWAQNPHWTRAALCCAVIIQIRYFFYRFYLQKKLPWVKELLTDQMLYVLRYSSPILTLICIFFVIFIKPGILCLLGFFTLAQLVWHGIKTKNIFYGICAFFLLWTYLLAWTTPGIENLFERITANLNPTPTIVFLLIIQIALIALEFRKEYYEKLKPLLIPFMFLASLFTVALGIAAFADAMHFTYFFRYEHALILLLIFLTARAHASSQIAALGIFLAYIFVHGFDDNSALPERIAILLQPLRFSLLGLALILLGEAGKTLYSKFERLMAGPFRQKFYEQPSSAYFLYPGIAIAVLSALHQSFNPAYRSDPVQTLAPFISAIALGAAAYFRRTRHLFGIAMAFWCLGNIHIVRIYFGDFLMDRGLAQVHLVCLGMAAAMLEASILKTLLKNERVSVYVNRACIVIAMIILASLSINYFVNPNLLEITWTRYAISGTMTLIAGLYFRRASRHPGPGEENAIAITEALYHYGVSMTIWCAALMIPWFRTPATALFALGLPVLYFYLNTEIKSAFDKELAARYRHSAATLSFIILALYIFRFSFRMILFPDSPIDLMHYHNSAPVIVLLSIVMFRLRGLGGTSWLAFYGGLALMTGIYFSFTSFPKLSPFYYPVNAAWCAIISSHFWTLLSYERSPVRTAIQRLAEINDESWSNLRRGWGWALLFATQVAMIWGLINCGNAPCMAAPLLLGGASIFIHQGIIKRAPFYYGLAAFEILLALHADFVIKSWLPKEYVIWSIVLIWTVLIGIHESLRRKYEMKRLGGIYIVIAILLMLHIFYHGASSTVGLFAFAFGALLAAMTPCSSRRAENQWETLPAALLLWTPTWLVYFAQGNQKEFNALISAWAVLAAAASFFITGICAKYYQIYLHPEYEKIERPYPSLTDRMLSWMGGSGSRINIFTLCLSLFLISVVELVNYHHGLQRHDFALLLALWIASVFAWHSEGARLKAMAPFFIMILCAFGAFAITRRQIELTWPGLWKNEYDIWATLIVSATTSGLLQFRHFKIREMRIPLTLTLCAMPVLSIIWTLSHHLGPNTLLLTIGLHSVIFVFMGKDDRESPYHIAAVSGFVAFLLILFWNKFEVKALHAYIIPVGIGILVLLQLFKERIALPVRNHVRFVTVMAMLGSAGFYALKGAEINIIYIMIFGLLALLAMLLGGALKIRLYLLLGFTGLVVDVSVIFCKLVIKMQRSAQMTIIGTLVLLAGVAVVSGAIFYKTHQDKISEFIDKMRNKLSSWE